MVFESGNSYLFSSNEFDVQTSIASPYVAHQQQMAAILAQRQAMFMAASAASGMKLPGNLPPQDLNSLSNDLSALSGGSSQPAAGVINTLYSQVRHADVQVLQCCCFNLQENT